MALKHPGFHRAAAGLQLPSRPLRALVLAHAAKNQSAKGFGVRKDTTQKDGCPCGSKKFYKECCKPYHQRSINPEDVDAAVRARFSAVVKKDVPYLMSTFHPAFHTVHYGTEPGEATDKLREDMQKTVQHWEYSNLRIRKVEPGDHPDEQWATFQYAVLDKRTPELDAAGRPVRKVQVERGQFLRCEDGLWRFADYKLVVVPEAVARLGQQLDSDLEQQFAAMGEAQQQEQQQEQQQQQAAAT